MTSEDKFSEEEQQAALAALREENLQQLEGHVHAVSLLLSRLQIHQLVFNFKANGDVDVAKVVSSSESEPNWRRFDRVTARLIDPKTGEVRIEGYPTPPEE